MGQSTRPDGRRPITGIAGVVLIAENYAGQVAFYRDVLGFEPAAEYPNATFFEIGAQHFAIFARGHHREGDAALDGASHGLSHLEFSIACEDEKEMEERLRDFISDANRKHFRDADGNIFHFVV